VIAADQSEFTRSYLAAMKNSGYFRFVGEQYDEASARAALARGDVQFVVNIPADFTRRLLRGERPSILIEADATDPAASGAAIASVRSLALTVARNDLRGPSPRSQRRGRPSTCACTTSTTPRASRSTTSCRGSWGSSSP
jgi:ABC-2 type transport system permease protein